MAKWHDAQGRHAEAARLYERALTIFDKALPPDHPDTASLLRGMTHFYQDIGNAKRANTLRKRLGFNAGWIAIRTTPREQKGQQ